MTRLELEKCRRSLAYFVEMTSPGIGPGGLDPWQKLLCDELQRVSRLKNQRLLIHAPPQVGKSQIVSKRFPMWLHLQNPESRVVIAAYNKTRAESFLASCVYTSTSPEGKAIVQYCAGVDPLYEKVSQETGATTKARARIGDGQPSLMSIGLLSGFTGTGADFLILDDPYASAQDARSEAVKASVESTWSETMRPRVEASGGNVIVMFHRYHDHDLAAFLLNESVSDASEPWKMVRFPAIADGKDDDPTGRQVGELLSPRMNLGSILTIRESNPMLFAGQYQGSPEAEGEKLFEPWMFVDRYIPPERCPVLLQWYRGWDTAMTAKTSSDKSATCKMAEDEFGNIWIRGFKTERVPPAGLTEWCAKIIELESHGQRGATTTQVVEMQSLGPQLYEFMRSRPGFNSLVQGQNITQREGSKRQRALPLAQAAHARRVYIVMEGDWEQFRDQLLAFTGLVPGEKDDLIDAATVIDTYRKTAKSSSSRVAPPLSPYQEAVKRMRGY